ncbi:MAG: hypothetical protein PHI63_05545 [Patescibacteria group bacterium]|nr:hypothetical protein [Patescibacteria group bacterium]
MNNKPKAVQNIRELIIGLLVGAGIFATLYILEFKFNNKYPSQPGLEVYCFDIFLLIPLCLWNYKKHFWFCVALIVTSAPFVFMTFTILSALGISVPFFK